MKIAVIAKTRLEIKEPFRGGLEAFTYTICQEYMRRGHDVTLYAHRGSDEALNAVGFYGSEHREDDNFEIYENDEYLSIVRHIEQNEFDIVHNNSTHEIPIIWGSNASVPVITTLHTPPTSKLKAAILLTANSTNLKYVMISKSFEKTWRPYTADNSKVIHNGIDLAKWPLTRKSRDYLLWYGRIVSAKGLDIALDVAHELGMPLRFAGSIDDEIYYDKQIRPRLMNLDMYMGHLAQDDILAAMNGASAMVNGTRWNEPFGLTNIEAMSAGVPISGFDRGAFKEIINEKSGAIAATSNVQSLADATRRAILLDSESVSQQARRFSVQGMVNSYINLFEGLL